MLTPWLLLTLSTQLLLPLLSSAAPIDIHLDKRTPSRPSSGSSRTPPTAQVPSTPPQLPSTPPNVPSRSNTPSPPPQQGQSPNGSPPKAPNSQSPSSSASSSTYSSFGSSNFDSDRSSLSTLPSSLGSSASSATLVNSNVPSRLGTPDPGYGSAGSSVGPGPAGPAGTPIGGAQQQQQSAPLPQNLGLSESWTPGSPRFSGGQGSQGSSGPPSPGEGPSSRFGGGRA